MPLPPVPREASRRARHLARATAGIGDDPATIAATVVAGCAVVGALLAAPSRAFTAEIDPVPPSVRARMDGMSWHGGDPRCPRWDALAYVEVDHVTFDGGRPRRARRRRRARGARRPGVPPALAARLSDPPAPPRRRLRRLRRRLDGRRQLLGVQLPRRRRHRACCRSTRSAARSTSTPSRTRGVDPTAFSHQKAPRSSIEPTFGPG